jgi:glutamine---fructose-6-phosphate transaminase (isomerizing)
MCGIVAYAGPKNAPEVVLDLLERLEYRGYDSCGIAAQSGDGIFVRRVVGRVSEVRNHLLTDAPQGSVAMGHTRWATHGVVSTDNCHPFPSCDGSIVAAHNGVIDNFPVLRARLEASGHRFQSDTDSEVIPHLVEQVMREGHSFEEALVRMRAELRGSYAIVLLRTGTPEVYALRKDSPLVVGVGEGEYFVASDIPSFLPVCSRVIYLQQDECLAIRHSGIDRIVEEDGVVRREKCQSAVHPVDLKEDSTSKENFDHFLIKEIMEEAGTLQLELARPPEALHEVAKILQTRGKIFLTGAGTSYHACLYAEQLFARAGHRYVRACLASEFDFVERFLDADSAVIALSQSGETADTLAAARAARERGATVIALTCSPLSSLGRMSSACAILQSGTEVSVAATKSYIAQLALLVQICYETLGDPGSGQRLLWEARDTMLNLTSDTARIHAQNLANLLLPSKNVYLLGRGLNYVTALEAALKLKEVTRIRAEAFPSGEMKHGPLALIEPEDPVIIFSDAETRQRAEVVASELWARGARIVSIGPYPLTPSIEHIRVDEAGLANPLIQITPVQMVAYELSKLRNLDPDHPRNLAKSVTVM